jgi:predicted porin
MKKSLIALAVAGVVSAPAFAASSNVDIYGTIRMSVDMNNNTTLVGDNTTISDQTSRIGFKGAEDLGGGLKAIWQIEQQLAAAGAPTDAITRNAVTAVTTTGSGTGTAVINRDSAFGGQGLRNTFVGIAGDFGTVIVGRHDTPYKLGGSADLFGDTAADAQKVGGFGLIGRNGFDNRAAGTVAYISPEWSGFHFAAAIVPGEQTGVNSADGMMDAYSLVGVYKNGPVFVSYGYEKYGKEITGSTKDNDASKLNASYTMGDLKFGLTYEKSDALLANTGAATERADTAWLGSVAYTMGPMVMKAQIGSFDQKNTNSPAAGDLDVWTVGLDYNLSKRTQAYVLYSDRDPQGAANNTSVFSVGLNHSF